MIFFLYILEYICHDPNYQHENNIRFNKIKWNASALALFCRPFTVQHFIFHFIDSVFLLHHLWMSHWHCFGSFLDVVAVSDIVEWFILNFSIIWAFIHWPVLLFNFYLPHYILLWYIQMRIWFAPCTRKRKTERKRDRHKPIILIDKKRFKIAEANHQQDGLTKMK